MISDETVQRVRDETGIVALIGESVKLVRKGRSFLGLCPFHKEKSPSFNVNEERNFYHCFGCGASGDALKFVMETEGLSFVEAVRRLAERAGITIVETGGAPDQRAREEQKRKDEEHYAALAVAASFFERMLREHPLRAHAERELERRGLRADSATGPVADTLQAFRIGYAPYGWDSLVQHLRAAGISPVVAERVGLLAPRKQGPGHYDRFRHRLMFAVMDLQGRVIAFSGRSLADPSAAECQAASLVPPQVGGDPPAKYVNSPESPVYRKREAVFGLWQARQAIRQAEDCVLVEGNFDVVSLHARGVGNVVAPLGTAFTAEQGKAIKRFSPRVTILFDGDAAGRKAARGAREPCRDVGLTARVASLPDGIDPDELVKVRGPDAVRAVIKAAQPMLEHLIEVALDHFPTDAAGRAARLREVAELVKSEDDPAVARMAESFADQVAKRLTDAGEATFRGLYDGVRRELRRAAERPGAVRVPAPRRQEPQDLIQFEIFGAVLDFPELLEDPEVGEVLAILDGDVAAGLAALRQACEAGSLRSPELVLAKIPGSINQLAAARMAAPRLESAALAKADLVGNGDRLKRLEHRRWKSETVASLHRAARAGDREQEDALLEEAQRRALERHGLKAR